MLRRSAIEANSFVLLEVYEGIFIHAVYMPFALRCIENNVKRALCRGLCCCIYVFKRIWVVPGSTAVREGASHKRWTQFFHTLARSESKISC